MRRLPLPEGTTHKESMLCAACPFRDDRVFCERLQRHARGCLILDSRRVTEKSCADDAIALIVEDTDNM